MENRRNIALFFAAFFRGAVFLRPCSHPLPPGRRPHSAGDRHPGVGISGRYAAAGAPLGLGGRPAGPPAGDRGVYRPLCPLQGGILAGGWPVGLFAGASPTPRCWWERPFSARRCSLWVSFSTSSSISAPAFPPQWFGLLYILAALAAIAGGWSHRLTGRMGRRAGAALLMGGGGALCLAMATCPLPWASVVGIMALRAAGALFEPMSLDLQNEAAPAGSEAAQLSCNAMVMEFTAAVLNPAFGAAADAGTACALLLGAAACGIGLLLFLAGTKR